MESRAARVQIDALLREAEETRANLSRDMEERNADIVEKVRAAEAELSSVVESKAKVEEETTAVEEKKVAIEEELCVLCARKIEVVSATEETRTI